MFNLLDLADVTRDPQAIRAAVQAAYHNAAKLNLYPVPPNTMVTVDNGGRAPIHVHSFGRHRAWGCPRHGRAGAVAARRAASASTGA